MPSIDVGNVIEEAPHNLVKGRTVLTIAPWLLARHGYLLGATGGGKTQICKCVAYQLALAGQPFACIDGVGGLVDESLLQAFGAINRSMAMQEHTPFAALNRRRRRARMAFYRRVIWLNLRDPKANGYSFNPLRRVPWLTVAQQVDLFIESIATYTEEAPNALTAEQVGVFLKVLKALYPQHYAMTYLGFATGLRPSSLRPLRRRGEAIDYLPKERKLRVRRSHTTGERVLNTTKQKTRYAIELPDEVVEVLDWHVATQLTTPEQERSDLLFPSTLGGFRAPTVLNKPFAHVSDEMGLGYNFTQRGMRRTFNDLARAARVEQLITKSISGHSTDRMVEHYSTVSAAEQRSGIAKVIGLMTVKEASDVAA